MKYFVDELLAGKYFNNSRGLRLVYVILYIDSSNLLPRFVYLFNVAIFSQTHSTSTLQNRAFEKPNLLALAICGVAFIFWLGLLTYKYFHFGYYDWDFALYAQVMWSLCHGSLSPSLFGMNFLGNHTEYIAFLLVPLYLVFHHPLALIALKILSYTLGAYILFLIAKRNLPVAFALILMILYLAYPANLYALIYEFHFESLAIGFLFLLFYFFQTQKFIPFSVTMVLTGLIKENMLLVVVAFGIYGLFARDRDRIRWGLIPIVFGLIVFYASVFLVIPTVRQEVTSNGSPMWKYSPYFSMYQHLGSSPMEIMRTFVFQPWKVFQIILEPYKRGYITGLFGPLLFLAFLSPQIIFLISPVLLQQLLSSAFQYYTIGYHYGATVLPFVFLATIRSWVLLKSKLRPVFYHAAFFLITLACLFHIGFYQENVAVRIAQYKDPFDPFCWQMISKIPPQASVTATLSFLAELSQRKSLYSFRAILQGIKGISPQHLKSLPEVSWALIDFEDGWIGDLLRHDPKTFQPRMQDFFLNHDWVIKDAVQDIVLLEKGVGKGGLKLIEQGDQSFHLTPPLDEIIIDDNFQLLKAEFGNDSFGRRGVIPLKFHWRSLRDLKEDYQMVFLLKKNARVVYAYPRRIGYTVLPTSTWSKETYVTERYWFLLPPLDKGEYTLSVMFYNINIGKKANVSLSKSGFTQKGDRLDIGSVRVP